MAGVIHNATTCFTDSTGQPDTIDRLFKVQQLRMLKTLVELLLSDALVREARMVMTPGQNQGCLVKG